MDANAVGKTHAEVDRAYLAGLIDGDGCIMANIERHSEKKFGFRVRLSLKITQKDRKLLLFLAKKYGMGRIRFNKKDTVYETCDWIVLNRSDLKVIFNLIKPYTKTKHRQIVLAERIVNYSDATIKGLMQQARLADSLARHNVRSKGRRKNFASMIKARVSSND